MSVFSLPNSTKYLSVSNTALDWLAFTFLCFIFLLATGSIGHITNTTILWAIAYLFAGVGIFFDKRVMADSIINSKVLLIVPVLCFVSTLWSVAPERSAYAAAQYFYTTLIAIWLGTRFSPTVLFQALCFSMCLGVVVSLANILINVVPAYSQGDYVGAEKFFIGIYTQKNVLGRAIGLACLGLVVVAIQQKRPMIFLSLALALWVPLSMSKSVASILIYFVTLALPAIWLLARYSKRLMLPVMFAWVIALFALFLQFALDFDTVGQLLALFGKDSTLTGRTEMWAFGMETFSRYPYLGVGYQAYWQPGAFAEVSHIQSTYGAIIDGDPVNGFHNAYIEIMVALGILGLLALVATLLCIVFRCIKWLYVERSIESLGVLFFVVTTLVAAFFDVIIFRQHEIFYILLCMFYVSAYQRLK